ncbi:MAG: spike base protein, RCAP_Rcc01079 family [Paracoccaceae bacterium]
MDQFKDFPTTLTSPASNAASITPSDTALMTDVSRALYIGQTGDVSVEMQSGQIITFQNVQGGSILALRTLKIRQTGTTAVGIVSLW